MRIGEMAKQAGCPVVTVRFYEKQGLLKEPERTASNYRIYASEDLERLRFILHCRKHGIALAQTRQLLALRDLNGADCGAAHEIISQHLEYVEAQIASLNELKRELTALNRPGDCRKRGKCLILKHLNSQACACLAGGQAGSKE